MNFFVEKETPSTGGWDLPEREVIAPFSSFEEAESYLSSDKFVLAIDSKHDKFWHDNIQYPWDRYRIKPASGKQMNENLNRILSKLVSSMAALDKCVQAASERMPPNESLHLLDTDDLLAKIDGIRKRIDLLSKSSEAREMDKIGIDQLKLALGEKDAILDRILRQIMEYRQEHGVDPSAIMMDQQTADKFTNIRNIHNLLIYGIPVWITKSTGITPHIKAV